MEFSELKEFIKKLYPIQPIEFILDATCISKIEFPFYDGQRRDFSRIFYNRMVVNIKNMEPFYVTIPTHVEQKSVAEALTLIQSAKVHVLENDLQAIRDADVRKNLNRPDHGRDEILQPTL